MAGIEAPGDFRAAGLDLRIEQLPGAAGFGLDGDADAPAGGLEDVAAADGGQREVVQGSAAVSRGTPVGKPPAGDRGEGGGSTFRNEIGQELGHQQRVGHAVGTAPVGTVHVGFHRRGMEGAEGKGVDAGHEAVVAAQPFLERGAPARPGKFEGRFIAEMEAEGKRPVGRHQSLYGEGMGG